MVNYLAQKGNKVAVFDNGKARIGYVSGEREGRKVLVKDKSGDEFWVDERKLRNIIGER